MLWARWEPLWSSEQSRDSEVWLPWEENVGTVGGPGDLRSFTKCDSVGRPPEKRRSALESLIPNQLPGCPDVQPSSSSQSRLVQPPPTHGPDMSSHLHLQAQTFYWHFREYDSHPKMLSSMTKMTDGVVRLAPWPHCHPSILLGLLSSPRLSQLSVLRN